MEAVLGNAAWKDLLDTLVSTLPTLSHPLLCDNTQKTWENDVESGRMRRSGWSVSGVCSHLAIQDIPLLLCYCRASKADASPAPYVEHGVDIQIHQAGPWSWFERKFGAMPSPSRRTCTSQPQLDFGAQPPLRPLWLDRGPWYPPGCPSWITTV